jgi:hypothetical protein
MFTYKKIALLCLTILVGVPSVSTAASFTVSLVQGKTPTEAVQIIAEQINQLTGRVASLEDKQAQMEADISQNKSDTEYEIERLKLENENLQLKANEALTGTAETRANEARQKQCSDLGTQLQAKEDMVRAPFEARMKLIQDKIIALRAQRSEKFLELDVEEKSCLVNADAVNINDGLAKIRARENCSVIMEKMEIAAEIEAQKKANEKERANIRSEMVNALNVLYTTTDFKTLQDKTNALLCPYNTYTQG